MVKGKSRRLAVAARADTELTCQGSTPVDEPTCGVKLQVTDPTYITVQASYAPQGSAIGVGITWAGSCTLDGQTAAIQYGGIGGSSEPVIAGLTLPFTDPETCTVTVTAGASGGSGEYPDNVYLTVSTDGQPATSATPSASPSPSASATPSPSAAPVHLVRGFDGTCLRDTGDSAAERTKIVIWACDPTAQGQGWTYRGDELRIHGDMCVNAKGRGTRGSPLILWPCNGSPNEIWIHRPNGEYVLKANGGKLCLTDPAYSTGDGTHAVVGACSDARDQQWSLP
jgi:hypothetical protein